MFICILLPLILVGGVHGLWRCGQLSNDLYMSRNINQVIKSRRMRLAGHVACMGRCEVHTGIWSGNWKERGHLENQAYLVR